MNKVPLKIITPDGIFWNKEVDIVTLKTTEGYIGVLHGKSPMVASLDIAKLFINKKGSSNFKECSIAGGILYSRPNKVEIITDAIEFKENIDIARAEKARKLAEAKLKSSIPSDKHLAELALKKAINRISVKKDI